MSTWYAAGTAGAGASTSPTRSVTTGGTTCGPYAKAAKSTGPLVGEVWYDASKYLLSATSSTRS